jgi:putative toxin-antitoxin system antitoxin component (TIGR02293 family)
MSVSAQQIAKWLGGTRVLGRRVNSLRDLDCVVRQGLPKPALDRLVANISGSEKGEAVVRLRYRIVPRATYQRVDRFNLQVSETTERMARLFALAMEAFRDEAHVSKFMMTAHPELGGESPFDVALTEIGGRQVEEIIERGMHGLPA